MDIQDKESEILKLATEILSWSVPFLMTSEKLSKMKIVAGSVVTKTHDHLINQFSLTVPKSLKPRVSIKELVIYNKSKNSSNY